MAEVDYRVHNNEHSGELQVPFLQYRNPHVRIAPVCISSARAGMVREFASALARAAAKVGRPVLLVASSDFSHEQPTGGRQGQKLIEYVRDQDRKAIERILALDEPGLWRTIVAEVVTMCGYAPVAAAITYAKARGATKAELAAQRTSADTTGRADYVVGYAGIIIR
jgi:AmmeMemoRadiSam system protein B